MDPIYFCYHVDTNNSSLFSIAVCKIKPCNNSNQYLRGCELSYLNKLFSLSGKVSIVTGGSRGLGKSITESLLKAGSKVIVVGRDINRLEKTVKEFKNDGLSAFAYQCDVGERDKINKLFEYVSKDFGRLDILVNNAGVTQSAPLAEYPDEVWWHTLSVDLYAPFALCRVFSPLMTESGGGSIINITSINAERGFSDNPAYAASKGGLRQLTNALANDLASSNIRVNSVGPGYMRTDMTLKSWEDTERRSTLEDRTMLGRWGIPDDLAGITLLLASDASSYITGQHIYVDGGWLAKGM